MSGITRLAGRLEGYADAEDITDKERADLMTAAARLRGEAAQPAAVAGDAVRALRELRSAYVRLLESARDRIRDLGGECDPVDVMENADPALRKASAAIIALSAAPAAPDGGVLTALQECRDKRQAAPAPVAGDAIEALQNAESGIAAIFESGDWGMADDTIVQGLNVLEDIRATLAQDRASQGAAGVPEGRDHEK